MLFYVGVKLGHSY